MAEIGQILYNVDGIENTKPLSNEKTAFEILTTNIMNGGFISQGKQIIKLSVQGEPGVKLQINGSNEIMIGRTGIYELDERVIVTNLKIIPIRKYKLDEETTNQAKVDALTTFSKLNATAWQGGTTSDDFDSAIKNNTLQDWIKTQQQDIENFHQGYIKYLQGKNGIYKPINITENQTSEDAYEKLNNLIIDYVTENIN